ncbi:MAG: TldD/PmbA family protein [Myxococcota bacterium]
MPGSSLLERVNTLNPQFDFWSLRHVEARSEHLKVRQDVLEPPYQCVDIGIYVTVVQDGGVGYAASPDSSKAGLADAFERAAAWARQSARQALFDAKLFPKSTLSGRYKSHVKKSYLKFSLSDRIDRLKEAAALLKSDDRIVDWTASFSHTQSKEFYCNSEGARIQQDFEIFIPNLTATAHEAGQTQTRTLAGHGVGRQAGFELLDQINFKESAVRIGQEAVELVLADNCPSGELDLLLAPDQMMLQIHESIGHPLELDRILGDERNYAGTSFVTQNMFGNYQYGSEHLNVTFDPARAGEIASYAFDDEGTPAEKVFLIEKGILKRPLGGPLSQARADMEGVSNTRASSWNRPPIDRMANLNLEAGSHSMEDMISSVERGVFMESNISWSIDDSRNKFQFGCERGQLIENGRLTKVVRNPNYRGISATFWRNLAKVGNESTVGVYGTPNCGKGEPNQVIRVGHASPACLFNQVDVFGGHQ